MKVYCAHAGEPADGAALVFAKNSREARKVAAQTIMEWFGCEWIDVKTDVITGSSEWLIKNEADKAKIAAGVAHVIDDPAYCNRCGLWGEPLIGEQPTRYCETCIDIMEG